MAKAYLGLGGNVGDTKKYFARALEKLKNLGTIEAVSSFYKTEPVGIINQPRFLNAALVLETSLSPQELIVAIKNIEKELGRTPSVRNGPREIDIDILLYDDIVTQTDTLTIPHPRMHERAFVLVPLSEIAPETTHPVLKKTPSELLFGLASAGMCKKFSLDIPNSV